jgi:hypothetical protein
LGNWEALPTTLIPPIASEKIIVRNFTARLLGYFIGCGPSLVQWGDGGALRID